ncbi:hypothetical protein [Hydrocarboniphaga sp.]|uniref:alpha/beta hydrolase family esterase n=1 Tax=Hydrocarboniphaga sp. TaxID=2033016 RepID=UPI00262E378A|nr:hypothetical protein [Hydrocarboniphaga sp.]
MVTPTASCQQLFSPEAVTQGEDCTPQAETYCPIPDAMVLSPEPVPCDGVTTSEYSIAVGSISSSYLAIRSGTSTSYDAIYVALHYLNADNATFVKVVRLQELAKARKVLVIVPQAPGLVEGLGGRWPTSLDASNIDAYVAFLSGVISDAKTRFGTGEIPVYMAGLSNGGTMAMEFGCRAADVISSILVTAADLGVGQLSSCAPSRPIGTVLVHGTSDLLTPYNGVPMINASVPAIHAYFETLDACSAADSSVTLPTSLDDLNVRIGFSAPCAQNRRHYLVTVDGGGHNWPGGASDQSALAAIGLLGPHTRNFDATLQGYDLLRQAAGDE